MDSKIILFFFNDKHLNSYILIPVFIFHLINCILEHKYVDKKKKKDSNNKTNLKDTFLIIYLLLIIFVTLVIFTKIPIIKNIINTINFSFLIYILIIEPIFSKKLSYNFIESNTMMSSFLFTELSFLIINSKLDLFSSILNNSIKQALIIGYLFAMIFLIIYILSINIKLILYYLCSNTFSNLTVNINNFVNKIDDRYNLEKIDLKMQKQTKKITAILVATKEIIVFTCIIGVIRSLLNAIYYFFKFFINCFSKIQNEDIYVISKLSLFITIFLIYFIIQASSFASSIISAYEFVASTIIIPLLLEALLKRNSNT